jgi:hypothetical protein
MRIKSTYLGEIDLDVVDFSDEPGRDLKLATHDELKKLCFTETATKNGVSMHTSLSFAENGHYAYQSVISDKNGRRFEALGESLPDTLTSKVSREYPAFMAFKRAEDAAIIGFFGLEGKVYSDQQIETPAKGKAESSKSKAPSETSAKPSFEDPAEDAMKTESGPKTDPEPKAETKTKSRAKAETEVKAETKAEAKAETKAAGKPAPSFEEPEDGSEAEAEAEAEVKAKAEPEPEAGPEDKPESEQGEDPGSAIVTVGRYKGRGLSIREVFETKGGSDSIVWIAEAWIPRNEEGEALQKAARKFLDGEGVPHEAA